ncbi:MAG: SpoIIIAH-like family protein [Bacilli bacterium]|nr:SpoIIIAH-like family protein [Bacilli bacterium]
MVNKQGMWFLTLTSLALVLSVYYITMPNELLLSNNSNIINKDSVVDKVNVNTNIETSDLITSMRVDLDEERNLLVNELQGKLSDSKLTVDEKNEIYEDLRYLSQISSKESMLEAKIKDEFKLDSFIKIKDDTISVVIKSSNHDKNLALNIMKSISEEFSEKMYISVSFKE